LLILVALFCRSVVFAGEPELASTSSQALWVSNNDNSTTGFISELSHSQLQQSGIPQRVLNTGKSQVGSPGKLAFDGAGNLWIPFCGNGPSIPGLVAAFSGATLRQVAARHVNGLKPKVELTSSDFHCPSALAFDGGGNLWITNAGVFDGHAPSIIGYTAASLSQRSPASSVVLTSNSFQKLLGLAFDAAGDLWVADGVTGEAFEFTPQQLSQGGSQTPRIILQASSFDSAFDVAFDTSNNLWVSYQSGSHPGAVQMFASGDLTGTGTINPPAKVSLGGPAPCSILKLCDPFGIAFDQSGDIWIAQFPIEIFEFTPSQFGSGDTPLAHVVLASSFLKRKGQKLNFGGFGFLTFGPVLK
jgi:secreted PhoX family phosphatase